MNTASIGEPYSLGDNGQYPIGYTYRGSDGRLYILRNRSTHGHQRLRWWHREFWTIRRAG
jgi:hypothetical protein